MDVQPMGAGKSHTMQYLVEKGRFPLSAFVRVDPDEIRSHFPEYQLYVKHFPDRAGELTRKEAGYLCEILTLAALQAGKNVLLDGSLRDADWYKGYFGRLREEFPLLKLAILEVTAPKEAVLARAKVCTRFTICYDWCIGKWRLTLLVFITPVSSFEDRARDPRAIFVGSLRTGSSIGSDASAIGGLSCYHYEPNGQPRYGTAYSWRILEFLSEYMGAVSERAKVQHL